MDFIPPQTVGNDKCRFVPLAPGLGNPETESILVQRNSRTLPTAASNKLASEYERDLAWQECIATRAAKVSPLSSRGGLRRTWFRPKQSRRPVRIQEP